MREKTIRATLCIIRTARGERHESTYEVCTNFNEKTTVGEVADFVEGMEKLWRTAITAAKSYKNLNDITMDISESVYSHEDGHDFKTESYDRWYMRDMDDISLEKGEESIYLVPDTRYTSENRDMCIGKNVMRDMAFTMR